MHLSESVYFIVQSCSKTFELWKTLSDTYQKKVVATKIYLIRRLYNLRMKESDLVQTHLNKYKSLSSQISAQGTTIEDELRAMMLMSSLPSSWETFVTVVKYSEVTSTIVTEVTRRKSFAKDSADKAYVVQGSVDQPNNLGGSSSRPPINQRSRRKSQENRTCNYCKKPGHIKVYCRTLQAKTDKAQREDQKSGRHEEVNYVGSSTEILSSDPNILSIENPVELEVLLTTEESSTWLPDSGASYHVTPHRS